LTGFGFNPFGSISVVWAQWTGMLTPRDGCQRE
jgi:hypothetical protein